MTHVMAPDERRRRLASGADLHASIKRYDGAQPCSDSKRLKHQCCQFEVDTASDRQAVQFLQNRRDVFTATSPRD